MSELFSGRHTLAIPKSVNRRYPFFVFKEGKKFTLPIEDEVFRFDITVDYPVLVQVLERQDDAS